MKCTLSLFGEGSWFWLNFVKLLIGEASFGRIYWSPGGDDNHDEVEDDMT